MSNESLSVTSRSSSPNEDSSLKLHDEIFDKQQTALNVSENSPLSQDDDNVLDELNDTATIKFKTNEGEIFTKASKRSSTIANIKTELSTLFSIPTDRITIAYNDEILSDDVVLAKLGVEAMGIVELGIKIERPYFLNRRLIYEHIPNIDVIVVRANGYDLIVEIENQCTGKEWLGGYRHTKTNKYYYNASTQTEEHLLGKRTVCTQTRCTRDRQTNTPKTKITQTSSIPSITDRIVTCGVYSTYVEDAAELNTVAKIAKKVDFTLPTPAETPETDSATQNTLDTLMTHLRTVRKEIEKWNLTENEKLKDYDEKRRRVRRIEILDRTRTILLRIGREKRQLLRRASRQNEKRMLSNATQPKVFVTSAGETVRMDTLDCQEVRELHRLYNEYANDAVAADAKMRSVVNLQSFFAQRKTFEFSTHVTDLLQRDLDILTFKLKPIPSLKARIERFVYYYFQLTANGNGKSELSRRPPSNERPPHYHSILTRLQNDEMNRFRCFTSVAFQLDVNDVQHLVGEIWKNCSAISECADLRQLRLTRWQKRTEWSPWNCVLLSKHEMRAHLVADAPEQKYDAGFIAKIRNKHLQAKIHFSEISSFHEWFRDTEEKR